MSVCVGGSVSALWLDLLMFQGMPHAKLQSLGSTCKLLRVLFLTEA